MAFGAGTIRTAGDEGRPAARWPSSQTCPEDVFLAWLLGLPEGTDPAQAALVEIERIDRAAPRGAGPQRLRELMAELARGRR